jgi:predicted DsbA family dithiol-disulfide isomerase
MSGAETSLRAGRGMRTPAGRLGSDVQVEVWSDVVCPWCYIGKRRLETALARFPHRNQVQVVWRSFQLDPSIPEGETHATLPELARKYGRTEDEMRAVQEHVEQVAAGEGLTYHLADGVSGNTHRAHELLHLAAERGLGGAATERLLHAHFEEGRSVFDVDSLIALAGEVGLDEAEARAALTDRRYRDAVEQDVATARQLGATGVPFFVVDRRYGAVGAQPADLLLQILERAWADAHPVLTSVPPADGCTDESCAV